MATTPEQLTTEFAQIVRRLVHRATQDRPQLGPRLARAERIVTELEQPVVLYTDGTATVRSKSAPDQVYQVNGCACSCPDHQHRQRVCCHALAAGLFRRAQRELRDEQQRKRDYGAQYVAPGTPHRWAACGACGIADELNGRGLCTTCGGEQRFELTVEGLAALGGGAAA
jgi:hypothetical protein